MSTPEELMAMMGGGVPGQPQMAQEPMAGMLPPEMTTNPIPEMLPVQPDGLGQIDEDLPRGEVIDWTLRG